MNTLKSLSRWIDEINERIGRLVAWVSLGLVLVIFADVVMRYLFNNSYISPRSWNGTFLLLFF